MPASDSSPSSPLRNAAASWAPRSESVPMALSGPERGASRPMRTSATEVVSDDGSDPVQAAARTTSATQRARDQARIADISPN